jgi:hypothetical protein
MTPNQMALDAYCAAWLHSFAADNPYHTVSIQDDDCKHISAGLCAALEALQTAEPECIKCVKYGHDNWIQQGKAMCQVKGEKQNESSDHLQI